ncbi:hypothetical protein [Nitrospira sp. KM1]|uniref:hypothetical protein n=1 Tax=Nitrospira sp. KM1 TaxID=1936990 RepID=UPI0015644BE2|nr:hypothetical protein [Nitrospira sp. KM1]
MFTDSGIYEEGDNMIAGVRGAFFLMVAFLFFVLIISMFALGTVMRPGRWIERPRHAH